MTRAILLQLSCHKITDAIMAMLHFETTDTTSDLMHFQQIQRIKVILTLEPELREKHSKLRQTKKRQTKNFRPVIFLFTRSMFSFLKVPLQEMLIRYLTTERNCVENKKVMMNFKRSCSIHRMMKWGNIA